jgi:AcrR family transcriptional regulator
MGDLRERRHRETRRDLMETGIRLFAEHGYDAVTMDQIAGAAGVSRRTLYRHFPSKDRILLDLTVEWTEMWDETVDGLPPDTPARQVVEHAVRTIAAHLDAEAAPMRLAWRIVESVPALEPAFLANPTWTGRFVALLTDEARGPAVGLPLAVTIAGAYLGAVDATMLRWATGADERTVVEAMDFVLEHLAPLWPPGAEPGRR